MLYLTGPTLCQLMRRYHVTIRTLAARLAIPLHRVRFRRQEGITDRHIARDWLEAIKTGRQAGSNFDYGGPLTQVALLGAIAIRFPSQTLQWNEKKIRFKNNDKANAFINPSYREGWKL